MPTNNTSNSGLAAFPQEILLQIIKNLQPANLPTGTGLPLPYGISACKKAMWTMCLVSRLFLAITLPLMYHNVILTDQIQMASLMVNLAVYKERRAWVRWFAMLADYPVCAARQFTFAWKTAKFDTLIRATNWLEKAQPGPDQETDVYGRTDGVRILLYQLLDMVLDIPAGEYGYQGPIIWNKYGHQLSQTYDFLLQQVLYMLPRIEDILITASNGFHQRLFASRWEYDILEAFKIAPTQPSLGNLFKSLRSIRKQAVPGDNYSEITPYPIQPEFMRSNKWEFFGDDGEWFRELGASYPGLVLRFDPQRDLQMLANVVKLALFKSGTHPAMLRVILSSCNNLQEFTYTTNPLCWAPGRPQPPGRSAWPAHEIRDSPVTVLQEAIDEVKQTLTLIRLGWVYRAAQVTEEEEAAVLPHRVDVGGFPKLQSIDIDAPFRQVMSSTEGVVSDEADAGDHIG